MNEARLIGYLGLARRAGAFALGETALQALGKGKCHLLILAGDASHSTKAEVEHRAKTNNVQLLVFATKITLGELFGKDHVAILAITNSQLARQIIRGLQEDKS